MIEFSDKNSLKGLGLMTGTSCDGIDLVFVQFNSKKKPLVEILATEFLPYPKEVNEFLQRCLSEKIHISELSQFNFYLAEIYAEAIERFIGMKEINKSEIDYVAVHGQTLWHNPRKTEFQGREISSTYQAVNLSALSKIIELPVIGDFRSGDIALGGEGAPLVSIFDMEFLAEETEERILLNIGGIANVTYLSKGEFMNAFDCGPGNTLLDGFSKTVLGKDFDMNGEFASSGNINAEFLDRLLSDEFLHLSPPKSTGREKYNMQYLAEKIASQNIPNADVMCTLTEFTAEAISGNIRQFCKPESTIIVSGGGRNNTFLMEVLQSKLQNSHFRKIEDFGIPSDYKEAIAFAYLGYLFLQGKKVNLTKITGAKSSTILGILAI
ncbi:MAG: anhydro-N-acetylmuramic acid kinase [Ignavibacteria bacterium GWF2_33_9]|nr:MAG: anhydro-N-acetylmuramic acid kinase [Ignavibacteria bacterium GWF2_33_9]